MADSEALLGRFVNGRTDLVFDLLDAGYASTSTDGDGVSLMRWCAYYGDVSAVRLLLAQGEALRSLGENFDLNGAAFHGHWRLCQFLVENGAAVDHPLPDTGETPLHAALCTSNRAAHDRVIRVLLSHGANPNLATRPGVTTGGFMRDVRTRGETPLHRAAAFGTEETIQMLLDAGALLDVKDANGDSPLTWASWHLRPAAILRRLFYDGFSIHPEYRGMEAHLLGKPGASGAPPSADSHFARGHGLDFRG